MKIEIAYEMVIIAGRAHLRTMRLEDALEAIAPIIADMALERAAEKLKTMSFLLSIGTPEEGPFTQQDRVRGEVVEQACAAIRALKEPTP